MKELYTSPELKVSCFAPVERLANDQYLDFDTVSSASLSAKPSVVSQAADINFTIEL